MADNPYLSRVSILVGNENLGRLRQTKVILFGVGGVGSWCAEALVRTGIGRLTIVDDDCVAPSNVNRQMMATSSTVGEVKTDALRKRLLEIMPDAEITAINRRFTEETATSFNLEEYDYIIDAIDSVKDKATLILTATRTKRRFFSSMGAALKMDSTRIKVAEFYKVSGCPLARALRQRFKRMGQRPSRKFKCVYSDELLKNQQPDASDNGNGSLMHITAIFGLTLAGLVIQSAIQQLIMGNFAK